MASGDESDQTDLASAEAALSIANAATATPSGAINRGAPIELRPIDPAEYVERSPLTAGGMGQITVARDRRLGRRVALKELRANTPELRARFAREALLTAQLEHPGIVSVHEAGTWPNGEPFYAMRLMSGKSLDRVLHETTSVEARIALLPHIIAIAEALAFAHDQRVIHRDLKPHNVMVGKFGETVVIDWGLGKNLAAPDDDAPASAVQLPTSGAQTVVGAVMGTPAYMAPEQARGEQVDERADVYAIGAILFHVLAGHAPHAGSTAAQILADVAAGAPARARDELKDVPPDLVAILERAMAPRAADRYPSARELAADLRRFQTGQLVGAHRYTLGQRVRRFVRRNRAAVAIATLALVTIIVVGVFALVRVMSARRVAETERGIAEERLTASYVDRARVDLAADRSNNALAFALASADHGPLDPRARFLAARALEQLPAYRRRPGKRTTFVTAVPGSHDFVYIDAAGVRRWSPERNTVVWEHAASRKYGEGRLASGQTIYVSSSKVVEELSLADGSVVGRFETDPTGFIGADRATRWLAIPTAADTIDVFDAKTRARITTIPHVSAGTPLLSPDGERLLVEVPGPQGEQQQVIIDRAGKALATVCGDCAAMIEVGDYVAMVRRDMELKGTSRVLIVDWTGASRLEISTQTNAPVRDLAFDPTSRSLALSDARGAIEVRDIDTGVLRMRTEIDDTAYESHLDRTGRVWTLGWHTGIYVHDVKTGARLAHWVDADQLDFAIADDGTWGVVIDAHGAKAWPSTPPATPIAPSDSRVWHVAFTPDGRLLTSSMDGVVGMFDRDGKELAHWTAHTARLSALQVLSDEILVTSGRDDTVAVWDLAARRQLRRIAGHGHLVAASPNGKWLAIGGDSGVSLWDRDRGTLVRDLGSVPHGARVLHWSTDGSLVGALGEHGAVVVWTQEGKRLRTIIDGVQPEGTGHTIGMDFAFSPDARWLVRSGRLQSAKMFSVDETQPDRQLHDLDLATTTYYVAFDATGIYLTGDSLAARWNPTTGMRDLDLPTDTAVFWLRRSADEQLIFGGALDHRVHVWDVAHRNELAAFDAPDEVYQVVLSPDGTRLAAATLKSTLLLPVGPFTGDAASLRALSACRLRTRVENGELVDRKIDADACNHAAN